MLNLQKRIKATKYTALREIPDYTLDDREGTTGPGPSVPSNSATFLTINVAVGRFLMWQLADS